MIQNYRDLDVWKDGRKLVKLIYQLTKLLPKEELYGLISQLRRTAVSVPCNIAGGHSRHSTKDYVNFVSMAIGSLAEVDTLVVLAQDLEYITQKDSASVIQNIMQLQRMLHGLRNSLKAKF